MFIPFFDLPLKLKRLPAFDNVNGTTLINRFSLKDSWCQNVLQH